MEECHCRGSKFWGQGSQFYWKTPWGRGYAVSAVGFELERTANTSAPKKKRMDRRASSES